MTGGNSEALLYVMPSKYAFQLIVGATHYLNITLLSCQFITNSEF